MDLEQSNGIMVGWGCADITPDRPVNLYGQFHARISKSVNDPLTVTALALSSEDPAGDYVVMVSCDLCTIPQAILDQCRERVHRQLPELDTNKIILHATHIHTAPGTLEGAYPPQGPEVMTPTEYAQLFTSRVAEAAVEAWNSRQPGGISWGFGHAVVGHNRRAAYFDGSSEMYGKTDDENFSHIEGYEDHSVDLLFAWNADNELTGIIVNLACPSQVVEGEYYVSADFWHNARTEIRRRLGEHLCVLVQSSAAGDQSPHLLVHKKAEQRMLKLKGISEREEIGRRIANAVEEVKPLARKDIRTTLPFKHIVKTIALSARIVTDEELEAAKAEYARLEQSQATDARQESSRFVRMNRSRRVMERYERQQKDPNLPMELHVIRLGDIAFTTSRFEYYLDFGLRIKARSKAVQTFVIQLAAGGKHTGTYCPTARAEAGGGYSANLYCNEVGSQGGQEIVEQTVSMINELWGD